MKPGIKPEFSWTLVRFVTTEPQWKLPKFKFEMMYIKCWKRNNYNDLVAHAKTGKSTSEEEKEGSRDWPNSLPKGCSTRVVPRNIIFHGKISFEGIRSKIYVCVTFHNSHSSLAFPSIICILFNLAVQVGKTVYLWAKPMWVSSKKILDREKALTHKHFLFHHSPAILVTHSN